MALGTKYDSKFDISKEFCAGLIAAIGFVEGWSDDKSAHWQAGYTAGSDLRKAKNEKLNEYLVSIGQEPWGVVKLC